MSHHKFKVIPKEFTDEVRKKIVATRFKTETLTHDVDGTERPMVVCILEIDNGAVFTGFSHTVDFPNGEECNELPSLESRAYDHAFAQFVCYEWYVRTVIEHAKSQMSPVERWVVGLPFVKNLFG
ncbi:hypothetical protein [Methylocaldum szegediense]|uniref:hypothetical protein n=1 Tax=Methylocaldum szegediense TaxID=73780 RepID=UPI00040DDEF8|nr:hypothetical protein [Methylocaldum szegediense]